MTNFCPSESKWCFDLIFSVVVFFFGLRTLSQLCKQILFLAPAKPYQELQENNSDADIELSRESTISHHSALLCLFYTENKYSYSRPIEIKGGVEIEIKIQGIRDRRRKR